MMPTSSPHETTGYTAHRERQRARILSAAEKLFVKLGVDRVSMLEITAASGVQPSTLYQYFKRKEDIVWAITAEVLSEFHRRANTRLEARLTAFQKVQALLDLLGEDLELRPEKVRFMAQFDVLYARDGSAESLLRLERQLGMGLVSDLREWMKAGAEDGSMNPGLNPDTTLAAVLNAAIGMQRRLACLGSKVEQEYEQPSATLFREAMQVMLSGLRSQAVSTGSSGSRTARTKTTDSTRRSRS